MTSSPPPLQEIKLVEEEAENVAGRHVLEVRDLPHLDRLLEGAGSGVVAVAFYSRVRSAVLVPGLLRPCLCLCKPGAWMDGSMLSLYSSVRLISRPELSYLICLAVGSLQVPGPKRCRKHLQRSCLTQQFTPPAFRNDVISEHGVVLEECSRGEPRIQVCSFEGENNGSLSRWWPLPKYLPRVHLVQIHVSPRQLHQHYPSNHFTSQRNSCSPI